MSERGFPKSILSNAGVILLRLALCTLIFGSLTVLQAQQVAILPVQFTHFFKTYSLLNPASIGRSERSEFAVGNKSLLGAFSGVRTFYAMGHYKINNDSVRSRHVLGLTVVNDKEGAYIHRNRASVQYAVHVPLSAHTMLGAGIAAGFINYAFEGTNLSAGGSDIAPNTDLGCWIHRTNFNFGISFNQLIPSQLTPIDESYRVGKYYSLNLDKTVELHPDFSLMPALVMRYESSENYNADIALQALAYQNLLIAASYKYQRGGAISGGLDKIALGKSTLKLLVSYYTPLGGNMYFNPQSYDLMLSFVPGR